MTLTRERALAAVEPLGALPLPGWLAYAGAVLSGVLYFLAFGGMDVWPLAFVALVPLAVSLRRQPTRRAATLGWVAGTTMNFTGFFWLQRMLETFGGFPAIVCVFFVFVVCAYQGGRMGLLGWIHARATARAERRGPDRATLATGAAVVALTCVYGVWRVRAVDATASAAPRATVGVVQANMGLLEKRVDFDEGLRRHLRMSAELERDQKIDFVVWSETSAMRAVRDDSYRQELRAGVASRIGAPAVFGAVIFRRVTDARGYVLYNAAVSSDADGTIRSRYDKEYLLTFGEYIPFGETFPVLYSWSPNRGHFSPGTALDPLVVDVAGEAHRISTLICYEDILPRFTNDAVRRGDPELL